MSEEKFLMLLTRVRGLRVKTDDGPGKVWAFYPQLNRLMITVESRKENGPIRFDLKNILELNCG